MPDTCRPMEIDDLYNLIFVADPNISPDGTSVAWVGAMGPTRGKAQVYLDGKYVVTVDLRASSFKARRILFATAVPSGTHTIVVKGLGTSGRPTITVDAFYLVRPG